MSKIEWTDHTWNPTTGCTRVSDGCDHCYMFRLYPRLKAMGVRGYELEPDQFQIVPGRLVEPMKWRKPRMVFVNSMSDLFHRDMPFLEIDKLFSSMAAAIDMNGSVFQILTKRPGRAAAWWRQRKERFDEWLGEGTYERSDKAGWREQWPRNIWFGVSVENHENLWRIRELKRVPAPIRFVSAEPLLGEVDFGHWDFVREDDRTGRPRQWPLGPDGWVDWVIAGGESGPRARPANLDWFRQLRDGCQWTQTPFFLKQLGGRRDKRGGEAALLDGQLWRQFPKGFEHVAT